MPDLTNWTVFVVDDEPDNVNLVRLIFEFHDVAIKSATSGRECLAQLEQGLPTVLLIDIQMPEMSGIELLETIRVRWPNIPAVAMTAYTMQGDRERMMAAGFNGYIGKPIDVMGLVDDVVGVVNARNV